MVRSALGPPPRAIAKGPRPMARAIPAISVVAGSLLATLPIVPAVGWWPDFGLLMLLAWRIHRADCWPAWSAALLGLANDLVTGMPLGLSVALWPFAMLAMDVIDRRTMWRDWRIEWAIGAAFLAFAELVQWRIAGIVGAPVRFALIWPAMLIAALCYPVAAFLVQRLDRWRDNR